MITSAVRKEVRVGVTANFISHSTGLARYGVEKPDAELDLLRKEQRNELDKEDDPADDTKDLGSNNLRNLHALTSGAVLQITQSSFLSDDELKLFDTVRQAKRDVNKHRQAQKMRIFNVLVRPMARKLS